MNIQAKPSFLFVFLFSFLIAKAQPDRWQQRISYNININMNVVTNRFSGIEKIDYWNNSPDTLDRVFFHLYWNAFQPNSMMDVRSRELGKTELGTDRNGNPIYDWDDRVRDRIQHLQPDEIKEDYHLSSREKEVLASLVDGLSYKMIASRLNITYDTVRAHMKKIYEKLHVTSMTEAVAKAINQKLFSAL